MPCGDVHRYTKGEAERIIYALVGAVADAEIDDRSEGDSYDHMVCLDLVLSGSHDVEVYYEHVQACVEARRERH